MRRLSWALLLPLFLLFTQQGALHHAIGHVLTPPAESGKKAPDSDAGRCEACLAYSQLAATTSHHVEPPGLLVDLAFSRPLEASPAGADGERPAARSRGPPAL